MKFPHCEWILDLQSVNNGMKEENNWFSNTKLGTNYDLWRSVGRPTKSIWLLATSYISVIWICGNKSWSLGKTKAIPLPGHKWPLAKKKNEIAFHAPTLIPLCRNGIFCGILDPICVNFTPFLKDLAFTLSNNRVHLIIVYSIQFEKS